MSHSALFRKGASQTIDHYLWMEKGIRKRAREENLSGVGVEQKVVCSYSCAHL